MEDDLEKLKRTATGHPIGETNFVVIDSASSVLLRMRISSSAKIESTVWGTNAVTRTSVRVV